MYLRDFEYFSPRVGYLEHFMVIDNLKLTFVSKNLHEGLL